jgi:phosphate transport system substrate-binding protein
LALLLPAAGRAEEALRVSGTGTALGAMRLLATSFEKANPGRQLHVLASVGSGGAFKAVAQGALDVGISARALRKDEFGLGLVAIPYAKTPFLFAAGPRTGVTGVTSAEVERMFRGELTRWPNGERIRVVLRPRSDADTQLLLDFSPELGAAVEAALGREGMLVAGTNQECNAMLVRTPGSIGPTSLTQIVTEGLAVTPLSWNGVAPTLKNLDAGAYPLGKTLYLVIRAPAPPRVRRLVSFLATPEARRILEKAGNLPLHLPPLE